MIRNKVIGKICAATALIMLLSTAVKVTCAETNTGASGSYNIEVSGYDWGPSVNRTVITLDKEVSEVNKDMFKVLETKNWYGGMQSFDRTITNAYLSDTSGNKVQGNSKNITLELKVSPDEGSPFLYDMVAGRNNWTKPYSLKISLADGQALNAGGEKITEVNIKEDYVTKSLNTVDKFKEKTYTNAGDISMKYAYYEPQEDNKKNPLIIWLHGAGEGGSDTSIVTLGNRVGRLVEDNIQNKFGGAYVLAPQSPTIWMDANGKAEYTTDGSSIYTSSLLNLIKSYVSSNPDIDTDRIYIGGCSNGGYMTMSMVMQDPDYFAAAYPICEAYGDGWISDEKINSLKDLPIWFTYAKTDQTVNYLETAVPTMERLKKAGNTKVHASVFDNVVDTSGLYKDEKGNPYEYNGHWSWIYAFNDKCKDGDLSLWSWLADQAKVPAVSTEDPAENKGGSTGDAVTDDTVKPEEVKADGEVKKDQAPKTADPISLATVIAGLVSAGAVSKLRKK